MVSGLNKTEAKSRALEAGVLGFKYEIYYLFKLFMPQFLHLQNGNKSSIYFIMKYGCVCKLAEQRRHIVSKSSKQVGSDPNNY